MIPSQPCSLSNIRNFVSTAVEAMCSSRSCIATLLLSTLAPAASLRAVTRTPVLLRRPPITPPALHASAEGAILRCRDLKTSADVTLVGTMHYNPASIELARTAVLDAAERGSLTAVMIESCPTRWNRTLTEQPAGSLLRKIFDNEMQAAAEAGEEFGAELVLADQPIEDTGRRLGSLLSLTLVQLLTPWKGGWTAIADDFSAGLSELSAPDGIGVTDLLRADVLLSSPIALVRYPVAILARYPLLLGFFVGASAVSGYLGSGADGAAVDEATRLAMLDDGEYLREVAAAIGFAILETVVLGRVMLVGLIEERNFVLARNIRRACLGARRRRGAREVVVILGAAHLNGVQKLLTGSRIV